MEDSNYIFISYNQADKEKAEKLRSALRAERLNVWWSEDIHYGKHWPNIIDSVLKKSCSVVVLWSEKSIKSEWVQYEASIGKFRDILIHAKIEKIELPSIFSSIQAADLSEWKGSEKDINFNALLGSINDQFQLNKNYQKQQKNSAYRRIFIAIVFALFLSFFAFTSAWKLKKTNCPECPECPQSSELKTDSLNQSINDISKDVIHYKSHDQYSN